MKLSRFPLLLALLASPAMAVGTSSPPVVAGGGSTGATLPFPGIVYATSATGGTIVTATQLDTALGTLPVANGGTGLASPTGYLTYNGTSATPTASATIPSTAITGLGTFATQNYATPPAIGGTTPAAGSFTTLGATGSTVMGSGSANKLTVAGAATGNNPTITASGSDPNVSLTLMSQGTGNVLISNSGNPALQINSSNTSSMGFNLQSTARTWQIGVTGSGFTSGFQGWYTLYDQSGGNTPVGVYDNIFRVNQGTAYSWSNSGSALANTDTGLSRGSSGVVDVGNGSQGDISGKLQLTQVIGGGSVPTIAAGSAAGTSPTVSATGATLAGLVSVTTGTATTASGTLATITYAASLTTAPQGCTLTPRNAVTALAAAMIYVGAPSTTAWNISVGSTALTASTAYSWSYSCF